jgi:hypothetical protein
MIETTSILSRRRVLTVAGAALVALAVAPRANAAPTPGPTTARPRAWNSGRSANGWPIGGATAEHRIEGTDLSVVLAQAPPPAVLLHAVRRVNYEVDTLRAGDVVGLTTDRLVASPERSNLLSGTAVHIRAGSFPRGTDGNLFPDQVAVFEDIVTEAGGVLGWGGHLSVPDQGLLYLAAPPASRSVVSLAERFGHLDRMNVEGGAGDVDVFDAGRRRAVARFLQRPDS